jgi:hydroxysqualene synthase
MPAHARHRQENFPVASWLCPPELRAPILAIYHFARCADDIADEGSASPAERQAQLLHMRRQLMDLPRQPDPSAPWAPALAQAMQRHALPLDCLVALLDAFEQDTWKTQYADRAELLGYCQRSANPIGRLLLHLVDLHEPEALQQSDAICTALQLINHWQDLSVDVRKPRLYVPLDDLKRHGVRAEDVLQGRDSPQMAACVRDLTQWALALMEQGRPLAKRMPGRMGWELRWVVEGGTRVAEKIAQMQHRTLLQRPRLRAWDAPLLLARALRYRTP